MAYLGRDPFLQGKPAGRAVGSVVKSITVTDLDASNIEASQANIDQVNAGTIVANSVTTTDAEADNITVNDTITAQAINAQDAYFANFSIGDITLNSLTLGTSTNGFYSMTGTTTTTSGAGSVVGVSLACNPGYYFATVRMVLKSTESNDNGIIRASYRIDTTGGPHIPASFDEWKYLDAGLTNVATTTLYNAGFITVICDSLTSESAHWTIHLDLVYHVI